MTTQTQFNICIAAGESWDTTVTVRDANGDPVPIDTVDEIRWEMRKGASRDSLLIASMSLTNGLITRPGGGTDGVLVATLPPATTATFQALKGGHHDLWIQYSTASRERYIVGRIDIQVPVTDWR